MELNTCTTGEDGGNNDFFHASPCVAYVSKKLFTYPSPKPTLKREVSVIFDLGEGHLGSFPETHNELSCLSCPTSCLLLLA